MLLAFLFPKYMELRELSFVSDWVELAGSSYWVTETVDVG